MALIVEDGSNIANANSYAALTTARAYASARGLSLPADDAQLEALLIQAMDYVEAQRSRFQGVKANATQALQWPRTDVVIDGVDFPANAIPVELVNAQIRLAVEANAGVDLMPTQSGPFVVEDTTGPLTTKYSEKIGTTVEPTMTAVDVLLKPLFGSQKTTGAFLTSVRV